MSTRIHKGDKVIVIAGKDTRKTGKILKIFTGKQRAIVEGVNLVKKHIRRRSESEPGGIKQVPAPIHLSNLALLCPHCNRGVRFSVTVATDKSKARVCAECQKPI